MSALLLNLRSLEVLGVFEIPEAREVLNEKVEHFGRARILPMDVIKAYRQVGHYAAKNALVKGFASTFEYKIPAWQDKRVALFLDTSVSMQGKEIERAIAFVASILPSLSEDKLTFATFDTNLYLEGTPGSVLQSGTLRHRRYQSRKVRCPKVTGVPPEEALTRLLKISADGGGTDTSLGLTYLLHHGIEKDIIILVTDEQQNMSDHGSSGTAYRLFKEYQKKVNPKAMLVILNPTDLEWHNAFIDDPSVLLVNSVTPTILKALPEIGQAWEIIKKVDLKEFVTNAMSARNRQKETDQYVPIFLEKS